MYFPYRCSIIPSISSGMGAFFWIIEDRFYDLEGFPEEILNSIIKKGTWAKAPLQI